MYDVVVVGAGPAGSMCAKIIAEKGYSVVIIDGKKEIGVPIQCGEAISEYALKNVGLPRDESWFKKKLRGVKCYLPNNTFFYNSVPTLSIDRKLFDTWLVDQSINQGSTLLLNHQLKDIMGNPGQWNVITSKKTIEAKIIVGADGPKSKTSCLLNLRQHARFYRALEYKFNKNDCTDIDDEWLSMYWGEKFNGGYGWVFPRGDEYNIGIGGFDIHFSSLDTFCKSLVINPQKKIMFTGGFIMDQPRFSNRAGKGYVIIGDAAGLINPVTGGGIHAALFSGKVAGEIIHDSLNKENLDELQVYDTKIKKSVFLHPIHQRTAAYLREWNDKDWNFLGNAAQGMNMTELSLWKSFLIGLKYPRYFLRSRELLTIRKEMELNKQCM